MRSSHPFLVTALIGACAMMVIFARGSSDSHAGERIGGIALEGPASRHQAASLNFQLQRVARGVAVQANVLFSRDFLGRPRSTDEGGFHLDRCGLRAEVRATAQYGSGSGFDIDESKVIPFGAAYCDDRDQEGDEVVGEQRGADQVPLL